MTWAELRAEVRKRTDFGALVSDDDIEAHLEQCSQFTEGQDLSPGQEEWVVKRVVELLSAVLAGPKAPVGGSPGQ